MKGITKTGYFIITAFVFLSITLTSPGFAAEGAIKLPEPSLKSDVSIEQALAARRSLRTYADKPIALENISQLLWAAQGITDPETGHRTAPSGMAGYPLKVYAACFNVTGIPQGAYLYEPDGHKLTLVASGDTKDSFTREARPAAPEGRGTPADAPADSASRPARPNRPDPASTAVAAIVITADTEKSYSSSGYLLEAGHVAQNIVLQCVPLDMGGVTTASFSADKLKKLLKLPETEVTVYVLPVGKK